MLKQRPKKGTYRRIGKIPKHCFCKVWTPARFGKTYIPRLKECRDCGSCMGPHTLTELWLDQIAITQLQ